MGTDISGWIEVLPHEREGWFGVVKIDWLVERAYGMFGSLFGRCNVGEFSPVAAGRGTPPDVSDEVRIQMGAEADILAPSWLGWDEIAAIDWEEEGQEETLGGVDYGRKVRRRDALTPGWSALFELMGVLADRYGDANVRLVVWFDQ